MGKFEDALQTLRDQGIDDTVIQELADASPIRKERDDFKTKAEQAEAKASKAQRTILQSVFASKGVKTSPDLYRFPDELDLTDVPALEKWGTEQGIFAPPPPDTPKEEQQTHQQMEATANSGSTSIPNTFMADLNNAKTEQEALAVIAKAGLHIAGDND